MNSLALSVFLTRCSAIADKVQRRLGLALADEEDGAVMVFRWCNKVSARRQDTRSTTSLAGEEQS